ncbi:MAG: NAD-dependent epimerase/dehydratase family protein [Azospirillum sp.]|nr:NAD-dependent epimerase/dehydratase family protein [Azospirillum sp.]
MTGGNWPEAVVLFGASGFIGRNLVAAFSGSVDRLVAVTGRGRPVPGCHQTVALEQVDEISALPDDTVVVNVAAVRYQAGSFHADQSLILDVNSRITTGLYRFCVARRLSEVRAAGSSAVFPAGWALLDDERKIDLNDWPHDGEAGYAWSKRWAELCADIHQRRYGINTLTFRLTNPYGPFDSTDPRAAHVAAAFVIKALQPTPAFEIAGNPDARRDFVFAGDVAAVFRASLAMRGVHDACNLAQGELTSIRTLAETVLRVAGLDKPVVVTGTVPAGVAVRDLTARRLHRLVPDLPPFQTLEAGLASTVAWYRDVLSA